MNKELLKEIERIKKLSNIQESNLNYSDEKTIINEGIIDDITKFISKASKEVLELPAAKKLIEFYNKILLKVKSKISPKPIGDSNSEFKQITNKIIDGIEGGYYHPSFQKDGAKNVRGQYMSPSSFEPMGRSGETMFGIDRKHGGKINETSAGLEFWSIIDNSQETDGRWAYGYRGGIYEDKLRDLASDIMFEQYNKNADSFFTPKTKKIVEGDKNLFFQFAYASWNGSLYFKNFANAINKEIENGNEDVQKLYDIVVQERAKMGQSSKKIAKIDNLIQNYA